MMTTRHETPLFCACVVCGSRDGENPQPASVIIFVRWDTMATLNAVGRPRSFDTSSAADVGSPAADAASGDTAPSPVDDNHKVYNIRCIKNRCMSIDYENAPPAVFRCLT